MAQGPLQETLRRFGTIQDVAWTEGEHVHWVTQPIVSPAVAERPVEITGAAHAEFVSGTTVRLLPGFHAGGFANDTTGRFRARIDGTLGPPGDVVVIAPDVTGADPYGNLTANVVHVHKWEKLEVGLRLPQAYQAAIDSFFQHYYSNGVANDATPGLVDPLHDLNPYADDSLQVVMLLTSPSGQQRMKWGFFMREAHWTSDQPSATLAEHTQHALHPYTFRFRFAPDEPGAWSYTISVQAPYTSTSTGTPLPALHYTGYGFQCLPELADNKGYLHADTIRRRILRFDDGTPFIGLGVNMADWKRYEGGPYGNQFVRADWTSMQETMGMLHEVGGNFLRMFLIDKIFSPDHVNLGVYDAYRVPMVCSLSESSSDTICDRGWNVDARGNGQYQAWAFDQMLETARENGIYIQLCIDPYSFPGIGNEKLQWGSNAMVRHFLNPLPRPYDVKRFFFAEGNPDSTDHGVFRYWKRKYKYIMSRWGYSVNIAAFEPFNEIDQMLTYCPSNRAADTLGTSQPVATCTQSLLDEVSNRDICRENRTIWYRDPAIPGTVSQWFTRITDYVRGTTIPGDPYGSPLGEKRRPFLISYAGGSTPNDAAYYAPLYNPAIDLVSVHQYLYPSPASINTPDVGMHHAFNTAQQHRAAIPASLRKPFTQGEYGHLSYITMPGGARFELEKYFHNYDVSFHNELWTSFMSGNFSVGTSWQWERVFWWKDALPVTPDDFNNRFQQGNFTNTFGTYNLIDIGLDDSVVITNRRLHHHFKPLSDLLSHPSWTDLGFFDGDYTPHKFFIPGSSNVVEAYYMKSADRTTAIGWVHNRNAWVMNNYYLFANNHNFLGCTAPATQTISLSGFEPGADYHITWFPTRPNSTVLPDDRVDSTRTGTITLDLSSNPLGGTVNNYLDTLRADYAFIITSMPFAKSMQLQAEEDAIPMRGWDFRMYPNPSRQGIFLEFPDDVPKEISIWDTAGRAALVQQNVSALNHYLPLIPLATGMYWVRVTDGDHMKVKKLIIH